MKHLFCLISAMLAFACARAGECSAIPVEKLSVEQVGPSAWRVRLGAGCPLADQYFYGGRPAAYAGGGQALQAVAEGDTAFALSGPGLELRCRVLPGGKMEFEAAGEKHLYGLGQFQDGHVDVNGLTRRLTQVNTQISLPMVISDAGYGILWNNCGLVDFNPSQCVVRLEAQDGEGESETVDATSTAGNVREERHYGVFEGEIDVPEDGEYAILLDVGQSMARRHMLSIDGQELMNNVNMWLPPTNAARTWLSAGKHRVQTVGEKNDRPAVGWRKVDGRNSFSSPGAQADFTVFAGTPDQIIAQYRQLTGQSPMLPKWAFGYTHCRERYVSQADLLQNAAEFRRRGIPLDIIVQDWQWWGSNGWNAMEFDQEHYPDPKAMADSLHAMDVKAMLSVWAKVDKNSDLGRQMEADGRYIPGTDWIDFFDPASAEAYWQAYRQNLVPTGIDAWWQDATEPENDDLHGRSVAGGKLAGDDVRNVYPIVVNDRVYRGLLQERPDMRPLILTRSAAPGIQRYGVVTWSGDVGNSDQTLAAQLAGGLGQMAAGVPWWTYDAGGFFRPGDQYDSDDYQRRMLRWIRIAAFLPMMRVHGYMSKTEPWRYSDETYREFVDCINLRYRLLPYVYSEASRVSREGYTLMRPLVFDLPQMAGETTAYMLGENLLVVPDGAKACAGKGCGGCCKGGAPEGFAPFYQADGVAVYAKAGAIMPLHPGQARSTADISAADELDIVVYPGADGAFSLYDDDGVSQAWEQGDYTVIPLSWDDAKRELTIGAAKGQGRYWKKQINCQVAGSGRRVAAPYNGKKIKIKLP